MQFDFYFEQLNLINNYEAWCFLFGNSPASRPASSSGFRNSPWQAIFHDFSYTGKTPVF